MKRLPGRGAFLVWSALALAAPRALTAQTPSWWSNGVCYEVFIRSYYDSDGDGIGDLRGLIEKLPYINDGDPATDRDLGATCIWLMPVAQSPSYHGYDVSNYYEINRDYGTTEDFRRLVAEAHRRGIRIVVDLVLNHMSSEHPFFKSALLDRNSPWRDWFLWSPTQRRSIGWGGPTWHKAPTRDEYYYGLFWHGMPDLNLANPAVTAEVQRIARYWLEDLDVDGFRLDAVNHFFEDGDNPRNGVATHPWLRDFNAYVHRIRPGAFTVGELWDSIPTLRSFYPDQLDSYFTFDIANALVDAVRTSSARRLSAVVEQAQRELPRGRWSTHLRNHDQTRTMTEFRGDVARARLAATLLLTLPGIPFLYYGEEIGMTGDKPDPRLRTPMQWGRQPSAGFSRGQPWEPLQPDSLTANVAVQESDPASLLNHYRRLIHLRAGRPALGSAADFFPLDAGSDSIVAYLRRDGAAAVVVVANLSARPRAGIALVSAGAVLPPGRYAVTPLMGRGAASALRIPADGAVRGWAPCATLAPFEGCIYEVR